MYIILSAIIPVQILTWYKTVVLRYHCYSNTRWLWSLVHAIKRQAWACLGVRATCVSLQWSNFRNLQQSQCSATYARTCFSPSGEKTVRYSQAVCGQILAAGVMWPKCKQMTPPSVAEGRHVTGRANSGWKLLIQYMVQDQSSRLKSSTHDPTSQVEESLQFYCENIVQVPKKSQG